MKINKIFVILTITFLLSSFFFFYTSNNPNNLELEQNSEESLNTRGYLSDQRVTFLHNTSGGINLPFNVDFWGQYVHTLTQINVDWEISLPVDISVNYPDNITNGESKNVSLDISLPESQAYCRIVPSINFDLSWNVLGVTSGSANLIDWTDTYQVYFTTPLGSHKLPIKAEFNIPLGVADLVVSATPTIIEKITASILSNPNFQTSDIIEFGNPGLKNITLSAKHETTDGFTTVTIGNFQYKVYLGLEWAISLEFNPPYDLINAFLDALGCPLEIIIGTYPKIEVGSISSSDEISFQTEIISTSYDAANFSTAMPFDPYDWYIPQNKTLPGNGENSSKYYKFYAAKDWKYNFQLQSCTNGVDIDAFIYSPDQKFITSADNTIYPDNLSFIANKSGYHYFVIEPNESTSCILTVECTEVIWPGKYRSFPIEIDYPYYGDYDYLLHDGDALWYSFNGTANSTFCVWIYEYYEEEDDIDVYIYYENETSARANSTSNTDNPEIFGATLSVSGTWYIKVVAWDIGVGLGSFWLDFGYSILGPVGYSPTTAIPFNTTFNGTSLGLEPSSIGRWGATYYKTNCTFKNNYTFTFTGDENAYYIYVLYDTNWDVIQWGKYTGNSSSISFKCLVTGTYLVRIIPYYGGFTYGIEKSSEPFTFLGEDLNHSQGINTNIEFSSELPTVWNGSYWYKAYLHNGSRVFLELEFDPGNNYDIFLYDDESQLLDFSNSSNTPENIRLAINSTDWYYIKINDTTGSGWYNLTIVEDSLPPLGIIHLNNGQPYTTSTHINVRLAFSDNESGVYQARYSSDGVWDTEVWEAPTTLKFWTLSSTQGTKTIFYQLMDNSGWISSTYSDSIYLDTEDPTGYIKINNDMNSTSMLSVNLSLNYTDSGSGVDEVRYSNDGIWDTENWEAPIETKAWELTSGEGMKTVYYQIKDLAGRITTYHDDINFKPPYTITITNPSEYSQWDISYGHYITWEWVGDFSYVSIYLYKDSSQEFTITSATSNDGSYYWSIPLYITAGSDYQIKIVNYYNTCLYNFSEYFEIKSDSGGGTTSNEIGTPLGIFFILIGISISIIFLRRKIKFKFINF